MVSFRLVRRNLLKHKWRSILTIGSLLVALFLLCVLRALVWSLDAGVRAAKRDRLVVQSAVSLFENLPMSYQPKIDQVPGVLASCKFHWFGGYYQDPSNFFAQFAVDPERLIAMYPEIRIVDGAVSNSLPGGGAEPGDPAEPADPAEPGFFEDRQGCIVGKQLADQLGWKVGDTFPLIGVIYPAEPGQQWEFRVRAIYEPASTALDSRTVFFHWDYFQRTLEAQSMSPPPKVATYSIRTEPGADQAEVARLVEEQFVGGERVTCSTEAEFNAQFVTMLGSIPTLVSAIGGGVLIAILFACVNTMLMAFREQTHDVGILKALGFTDLSVAGAMLVQSLLLCGTGGLLGLGLAKLTEPGFVAAIGNMFPGYQVTPAILGLGALLTLGVGLVAGIVPFLAARRLSCVDALRSVE